MILFPSPSWVNNQTGAAIPGSRETHATAVLETVDASQETIITSILTEWDSSYLDHSAIRPQGTNRGYDASGDRARKLLRKQLVSCLAYDPMPDYYDGSASVGRS